MSDNNQQSDNNSPPKTGGLLRNYKSQQEQSPAPGGPQQASPAAGSQPQRKGLLGGGYHQSSQAGLQGSVPQKGSQAPQPQGYPNAQAPGGPRQSAPAGTGQSWASPPPSQPYAAASMAPAGNQRRSGLLSGTVDRMRQWSGKMNALSGHAPQPPAPYMDVYRPYSAQPGFVEATPQPTQPWKRSKVLRLYQRKRQRRMSMRGGPNRVIVITLATLAVLLVLASFGGSAYGYSYYQQQQPKMQASASQTIAQNTRIYDRNGVLLFDAYDNSTSAYSGRRVTVTFDEIPKVMQDAMVAIEDKNFWTDPGIDPLAIVRAAGSSGGGSTLTQQVIKNLTHNSDPTYTRKLTEAAMAIGMTQQYPKQKILEIYFNVAPFGSSTWGVEIAAEDYFGLKLDCGKTNTKCIPGISQLEYNARTKKNDSILGLARASFLAAQPNGPTYTDPTLSEKNRQRGLERQKLVLQAMIQQGMSVDGKPITADMAHQAETWTAKQTFKPYLRNERAPHFVEWIITQMEQALGGGSQGAYNFLTGGYNIRTTIDVNLDEYVQRAITRHLDQQEWQQFPAPAHYATLSTDNNVNDAAAVVMDSKNGEVLAMVGSANFNDSSIKVGGSYNVAAPPNGDTGRSPGSTFKPIEYSTAFQMGWYPGMVVPDQETAFPNGAPAGTPVSLTDDPAKDGASVANNVYIPPDYGNTYHKSQIGGTLRLATANSLNVGAMRAMQYVGTNNVLNTAKRLGITTLQNNGMAWGLGAQNVPLIQMVNAYQTLANAGSYVHYQGVLDIYDNQGHNFYHYDENHVQGSQVFSPQTSYMMTSVLSDEPSRAFEFESDHDLSFYDRDQNCAYVAACSLQVAAKTGTTDSFKDNLTIGYTPDVVVGVWVGNANNEAMNNIVGITGAAPIWHSVMERTLGWCSTTLADNSVRPDQIPCGPNYNFRFSANPTRIFSIPGGVSKQTTSLINGLQGSGVTDYMLDGKAPQQSGYNASATYHSWYTTPTIPTRPGGGKKTG
ncbi:transglycosylase domain-containing protein [Dictyobacter arantiisoli]|uniref:PLD phosphodiesterase domain-containing protein n=1 Tax=Dictyobacter arantiisoli TaxID=2014874 RepID=A0A5A5T6E0_9CHLR|nr:transglycosylase domain-containing protein [Dictyobacter arantiisoli]GCF06583.1 hypothetical protein KDI_01470 [Dictyobacter arantiisoli]